MTKFNESITNVSLMKEGKGSILAISSSLPSFNLHVEKALIKTYDTYDLYYGEQDDLCDFGILYHEEKMQPGINQFSTPKNDYIKEELDKDLIKVMLISCEGFKEVGYITLDLAKKICPKGKKITLNKNKEYVIM